MGLREGNVRAGVANVSVCVIFKSLLLISFSSSGVWPDGGARQESVQEFQDSSAEAD